VKRVRARGLVGTGTPSSPYAIFKAKDPTVLEWVNLKNTIGTTQGVTTYIRMRDGSLHEISSAALASGWRDRIVGGKDGELWLDKDESIEVATTTANALSYIVTGRVDG